MQDRERDVGLYSKRSITAAEGLNKRGQTGLFPKLLSHCFVLLSFVLLERGWRTGVHSRP